MLRSPENQYFFRLSILKYKKNSGPLHPPEKRYFFVYRQKNAKKKFWFTPFAGKTIFFLTQNIKLVWERLWKKNDSLTQAPKLVWDQKLQSGPIWSLRSDPCTSVLRRTCADLAGGVDWVRQIGAPIVAPNRRLWRGCARTHELRSAGAPVLRARLWGAVRAGSKAGRNIVANGHKLFENPKKNVFVALLAKIFRHFLRKYC